MAEQEGHRVTLNVYDLSQGLARQLSTSFLGKAIEGIWHTGIVVYGNEYYFGRGIQHVPAGNTPYGVPLRVVDLGITHVPQDIFEMYLEEIQPRYTENTYSLLTHNCNNFSNEVAQFLVGATIPDYILNLPNEVLNSPMGPLMLPMIQQLETTLRAGAVPQVPQFQQAVKQPSAIKSVTNNNANDQLKKSNKARSEGESAASGQNVRVEKKLPAASSVAGDPLGDARNKVQEEITKEFAAIMASGTVRASEAAAMAMRRVMQKHGHLNVAQN